MCSSDLAGGLAEDETLMLSGLTGLGCLQADSSEGARRLFLDFCAHLLEPLRDPEKIPGEYLNADGAYLWAEARLMNRAARMAAENAVSKHFSVPGRDFALITRKLTGVFTFISVLGAEFNGAEIATRYVSRLSKPGVSNG